MNKILLKKGLLTILNNYLLNVKKIKNISYINNVNIIINDIVNYKITQNINLTIKRINTNNNNDT